MLTLYISPMSRATRVHLLVEELGIRGQMQIEVVQIEVVQIARADGPGQRDPRNPHPEGKVPLLVDNGVMIRESIAIIQYLADKFPAAGLSVPIGHPLRGPYLAWLAWYAGVLEPLVHFHMLGIKDPGLEATFRTLDVANQRVIEALEAGPWLVGDHYTAADLLLASLYNWQSALLPDNDAVRNWLSRCNARPAVQAIMASEMAMMQALAS